MEEIKSLITSVLTSTPNKITIVDLERDFYSVVGSHLPFRSFGFENPELFLRSIPDTVKIIGHGPRAQVEPIVKENFQHINEMIAKQKKPKNKRGLRSSLNSSYRPTPQPPVHNHYNFRNDFFHSRTEYPPSNTVKPKPEKKLNTQSYNPLPQPLFSPPERQAIYSKPPNTPQISETHREATSANSKSPSFVSVDGNACKRPLMSVPSYIANKLENVGINASSICDDDTYLSDEEDCKVPVMVKENLQRLIARHPEGIWCCDLPRLYFKSYGCELEYNRYGFRTLNEMCTYLHKVFHYIRPSKGDFKLYDKTKPIPKDLSLEMHLLEEEPKVPKACKDTPAFDFNTINLSYSMKNPNYVYFGEKLENQKFPEDIPEGDCIDLNVAEVYDPSKFWYNMYTKILNEMMDELQNFYMNSENPVIPEDELKETMLCVTTFLEEYHRAMVINLLIHTPGLTKVYFIDYGTVENVPTSQLFYMHKKFLDIPQQAMRGRLAGVFPLKANSIWSQEAKKKFFELVKLKDLIGKIEKIDRKKQIVHFTLIEPKNDAAKDIIINKVLVDEGLAVRTLQDQHQTIQSTSIATPLVPYLHLVPTFEELEFGLVPNSSEMKEFLRKAVPLEMILPQYFQRCYYQHPRNKPEQPTQEKIEIETLIFVDDFSDNITYVKKPKVVPESKKHIEDSKETTETINDPKHDPGLPPGFKAPAPNRGTQPMVQPGYYPATVNFNMYTYPPPPMMPQPWYPPPYGMLPSMYWPRFSGQMHPWMNVQQPPIAVQPQPVWEQRVEVTEVRETLREMKELSVEYLGKLTAKKVVNKESKESVAEEEEESCAMEMAFSKSETDVCGIEITAIEEEVETINECEEIVVEESVTNVKSDDGLHPQGEISESGKIIATDSENIKETDTTLENTREPKNPMPSSSELKNVSETTSIVPELLDLEESQETKASVEKLLDLDMNLSNPESVCDLSESNLMDADVALLGSMLNVSESATSDLCILNPIVIKPDSPLSEKSVILLDENKENALEWENRKRANVIIKIIDNEEMHLLWMEEEFYVFVDEILSKFLRLDLTTGKTKMILKRRHVSIPIKTIHINDVDDSIQADLLRCKIAEDRRKAHINIMSLVHLEAFLKAFEYARETEAVQKLIVDMRLH